MLLSLLDDKYNLDYMIYQASNNILDIDKIENLYIVDIAKYLLFKKFDNWVESKLLENNN